MKALLIPVKELGRAKQRLAALMSQAERTALAQAMMEDVFSAAASSRLADQVFLVSSYEPALARGRSLGWEIIREERQTSESESVDFASHVCAEQGVTSLLRLPIDVPLTLFPSHFGPDSLARHIGEAQSRNAPYEIVRSERLELDIDEAEDLARLCACTAPTGATGRWLAQSGYGWSAR